MPFPFGGALTHKELADKFGWSCIIMTIVLLPVLMLWSKLLAFPVWLEFIWPSKPKYTRRDTFYYPDHANGMIPAFYSGKKTVCKKPSGWLGHVDIEGGKFYEMFWGILNVLDLDANEHRYKISANPWTSWLALSNIFIEWSDPKASSGITGHQVRFYFPLEGPMKFNPFFWLTFAFTMTPMKLFSSAFVPFMEKNGITRDLKMFPDEVSNKKLRGDGSTRFEYEKQEVNGVGKNKEKTKNNGTKKEKYQMENNGRINNDWIKEDLPVEEIFFEFSDDNADEFDDNPSVVSRLADPSVVSTMVDEEC